jgi:outer membrane protein assembly factor BamB
MRRAVLAAVAVVVAAAVVLAVSLALAFAPPSLPASSAPPVTYPSEPFPALWQSNFTGTPMTAVFDNGTLFALTYGNATSSPPPFGPDYPWNLLAINASTGVLVWIHQILVTDEGNAIPLMVLNHGEVYFIQTGDNLSVDSLPVATGPALFAVGFSPSTGARLSVTQSPTSPAFFFGAFELAGTTAYLAWPVWNGTASEVTVEAVELLDTPHAVPLWVTSFASGAGNTNVPLFYVDSQFLVLPFGELWVLNAQTGAILYGASFSALGDSQGIDLFNGALQGDVFFFVPDWVQTRGAVVHCYLLGLDLADQGLAVNTTIGTSTQVSFPIPVRSYSGQLVVELEGSVPFGAGSSPSFLVFNAQGGLLWSSPTKTFSGGPGVGPVPVGIPVALLGADTWLLSSLTSSSAADPTATQYFESVEAANGTLLWTHAFTFSSPPDESQLYPPSGGGPPSVVILATNGNELAYRWGPSIGLTVL